MATKERKQLGVVGVDSGQVLVCDPCYLPGAPGDPDWIERNVTGSKARTHEFSYDGCCKETLGPDLGGQLNYRMGHAGAGVAASSGYGDGVYPVYAEYNEDGRVARIVVDFTGEE